MVRLGQLGAVALTLLALGNADAAGFKKPIIVLNNGLKVQQPVTPSPTHTYTFVLQAFRITDTRSRHEDTDFAAMAVAIAGGQTLSPPVKSLGDVNNGVHAVDMSVQLAVADNQAVDFSYSILNRGDGTPATIEGYEALIKMAADKGAILAGSAIGNEVAGQLAGALGAYVGYLSGGWPVADALNIIFADCDGPVAGGDHMFSGAQLAAQTANGHAIQVTDDNPGVDSPTGCGSNSHYYVTWKITG